VKVKTQKCDITAEDYQRKLQQMYGQSVPDHHVP